MGDLERETCGEVEETGEDEEAEEEERDDAELLLRRFLDDMMISRLEEWTSLPGLTTMRLSVAAGASLLLPAFVFFDELL